VLDQYDKGIGTLLDVNLWRSVIEKICIEADYFETSGQTMRHPKFREMHLSSGPGVIINNDRVPSETVRQVLGHSRHRCHHRTSLLYSQRPLCGRLGQ
jgi:hypothetical protein